MRNEHRGGCRESFALAVQGKALDCAAVLGQLSVLLQDVIEACEEHQAETDGRCPWERRHGLTDRSCAELRANGKAALAATRTA